LLSSTGTGNRRNGCIDEGEGEVEDEVGVEVGVEVEVEVGGEVGVERAKEVRRATRFVPRFGWAKEPLLRWVRVAPRRRRGVS
jgi:hypothetical protein